MLWLIFLVLVGLYALAGFVVSFFWCWTYPDDLSLGGLLVMFAIGVLVWPWLVREALR